MLHHATRSQRADSHRNVVTVTRSGPPISRTRRPGVEEIGVSWDPAWDDAMRQPKRHEVWSRGPRTRQIVLHDSVAHGLVHSDSGIGPYD